jgi:hypothetical protein
VAVLSPDEELTLSGLDSQVVEFLRRRLLRPTTDYGKIHSKVIKELTATRRRNN